MTTQKKKPVAKTTTKKSTSSITDKELGTILTETLAKVAEPEPAIAQPQPVKIDGHDKTAFMVVMLSRPEGATLKEMAEALGWKENSIRGAMSLYAKKTKVDPEPPNPSKTISPTLELLLIARSTSSTGFIVGCRSLCCGLLYSQMSDWFRSPHQ